MSDKIIEVKNRDSGSVGYSLPDTGVHRNFEPGEIKKIPMAELEQLQYIPGGQFTLKNLLLINDQIALDVLNIEPEPEYYYEATDVVKLLTEGTLAQLEDCLNFAPEGVIELIKQKSVELEIPDTNKRKLIQEKTGFSVNNAIYVNTAMAEETSVDSSVEVKVRKAEPIKSTTPERKAPVQDKYSNATIVK